MKNSLLLTAVLGVAVLISLSLVWAQEEAKEAAPAAAAVSEPTAGTITTTEGEAVKGQQQGSALNLWRVMISSGALGFILWLALFGDAGVGVYLAVDSAITIRAKRIMPEALINNVTQAMAEGDVLKALQSCENEPGPLANILTAGFSHVEEGFEIIQEAISTAADLETEKIFQKLTWMSVVANLATMLGLLGTVQGMIAAFASLGQGAPDVGLLAINIAQALYTTAAGLCTAIPVIAIFYSFKNSANRIILKMEAMTMELIKDLRNVEVVEE